MTLGLQHLPAEILSSIFSLLKPEFPRVGVIRLQNSRLVGRLFNNVASPYLISKAWISMDVEDWERLTKIAHHPVFGKYVEEIEYDNTYYEPRFEVQRRYLAAVGPEACPEARNVRMLARNHQ